MLLGRGCCFTLRYRCPRLAASILTDLILTATILPCDFGLPEHSADANNVATAAAERTVHPVFERLQPMTFASQ